MSLGAGRIRKEDNIDPRPGVVFRAAVGDWLQSGETVAYVHGRVEEEAQAATLALSEALEWSGQRPNPAPLIYARVTADRTDYYSP